MTPNRHTVLFTVTDVETGVSCDTQYRRNFEGGSDVAVSALAQVTAEFANGTQGTNGRPATATNFRLHSWHEAPAHFARAPLSGAGWDEAWNEGPGRDAL